MKSFCASAPVLLDKLELTNKEFVAREDPRFCWDWVVQNWSLVSRFDLACDVVATFREAVGGIRGRVKVQRWDVVDTRGFRTRYFGAPDADLRLRVYDRDWDALFRTGLIRLEWQLRGKRARRYLQSAFNGAAFCGPFGSPADVYQSLVSIWFKRFPVQPAGSGLVVLGDGQIKPSRDVWRLRTIESCLGKLEHVSPSQFFALVRSLESAWSRSGGDEKILEKSLDNLREYLKNQGNKMGVEPVENTLF